VEEKRSYLRAVSLVRFFADKEMNENIISQSSLTVLILDTIFRNLKPLLTTTLIDFISILPDTRYVSMLTSNGKPLVF